MSVRSVRSTSLQGPPRVFKYYNPDESGVVGASMDGRARWSEPASVPLESFWKNQNLPVTKDVSDEIGQLKTEEKSATDRADEAKTAADKAWVEALAAQRAAKLAEAKADASAEAADIQVASELAEAALAAKGRSETCLQEAHKAGYKAALAQNDVLSKSYISVLEGDGRHFESARNTDREILASLDKTLDVGHSFLAELGLV